jgi:hypothetical protein
METFKGKLITPPPVPTPKAGQVWKHTYTDTLRLITKITGTPRSNPTTAEMIDDCGTRSSVGLYWLNNKDFVYVGILPE